MKKRVIAGLMVLLPWVGFAQVITVSINQPDPLVAFAGTDTLICKNHSVILGSEATATGGTPDYIYSWYPSTYLDNPTVANPTCSPEETTTYVLTVTDHQGCSTNSYVTVAVDACLGIESFDQDVNLKLFPNPGTDHFVIYGIPQGSSTLKIKILNQLGQTLYQNSEIHYTGSEGIRIETKDLLIPGVYLVHIQIDNRVITKSVQIL